MNEENGRANSRRIDHIEGYISNMERELKMMKGMLEKMKDQDKHVRKNDYVQGSSSGQGQSPARP